MHQTAQAIVWLTTSGKRWFGLSHLQLCRDLMTDLGHDGVFRGMLISHGIPLDLDEIDVSHDVPSSMPQPTPHEHPYSNTGVEEYAAYLAGDISRMSMGGSFSSAPYGDPNASSSTPYAWYGDPNASSSTPYVPPHADRPHRDVHPPPRYSPSPIQRFMRNLRRR
jgi:hypothetical protein